MIEFETIFKILILAGGGAMILLASGFAIKALVRKPQLPPGDADRVGDLEARLAELEERVDFTERALTDVRGRAQIPKP